MVGSPPCATCFFLHPIPFLLQSHRFWNSVLTISLLFFLVFHLFVSPQIYSGCMYYSRTCLSLHFVPKFLLLAVCKSPLFTAVWYLLVESCQELPNAVGSWAPSSCLLLQCYEHPWYHRHVFLWCTSSKWNS